jgi:hypothetical protein
MMIRHTNKKKPMQLATDTSYENVASMHTSLMALLARTPQIQAKEMYALKHLAQACKKTIDMSATGVHLNRDQADVPVEEMTRSLSDLHRQISHILPCYVPTK